MSIISRYILRLHIAPFIFGTVLVMFLFLFQFLLKNVDQLLGKGLSLWLIVQLIGLNLSWMIVLAVPMGVLFSTLMAFGNMSSVHETTIIKSSGGSLIKMMKPVIVSGIILTILLFWFNDEILPEANHRAKVLMMDIQRKKPTFSIESGKFSQELDGYTIFARQVDSINGNLYGVTIYDTRNMNNVNIVSADTGIASFSNDMSKLIFDLYSGEIHQMTEFEYRNYRKINFEKYRIILNAEGFNLTRTDDDLISRGDREMHIRDMRKIVDEATKERQKYDSSLKFQIDKHYKYLTGKVVDSSNRFLRTKDLVQSDAVVLQNVQRRISFLKASLNSEIMRRDDYDFKARQYEIEIQKKYAIPFACLVFVLVGCPLGVMTKGGNFGISAAISLAFYILYWACLIGGEKLADRGMISPILGMWGGDILIFIIGIFLIIKVNNESLSLPGKKLAESLIKKLSKNNTQEI
ncbi:YjgP/YjgQ family permease [Bacteroidetes/Chlorobi group bacterium ChocPot_Mid]|nr:MAG: YjgP/YjgQ family permease [Bacteroidetes/Chlorobi group bacterium ChocPot_Mid]